MRRSLGLPFCENLYEFDGRANILIRQSLHQPLKLKFKVESGTADPPLAVEALKYFYE